MDFDEYQQQAKRTRVFRLHTGPRNGGASTEGTAPELAQHYLLSGLVSQVGEIANRLKKRLRDGADYVNLKAEIKERLGYALWYVATLADELGLSLNDIAAENLAFNWRRWRQVVDPDAAPPEEFDSIFPSEEQLPSPLVAQFETQPIGGLKKTIVWVYPNYPSHKGRVPFGDPIDDNSIAEDHYRYHDVYHFAYAAFLGWSPVVRKLLSCKRKSVPDTDRVQDGARARDTEEAATAFIFSYVSLQSYLETSDNVDTGVLTTVRTLLRAYEVGARAEKEWEAAILEASRVLRELFANEGGWVVADRAAKTVRYLGRDAPSLGGSK